MLRAISGLANPKHTETYVLFVKGYYGDGDEYFTEEISSKPMGSNAGEKMVESYYRAYLHLKDNWVECRSELPREHRDFIKGASWDDDVLPSGIDEISLKYYDQFGQAHDVEVS